MGMVISLEREQILRRVRKHREYEQVARDYRRLNNPDDTVELDIGPFEKQFWDLVDEIYYKTPPEVEVAFAVVLRIVIVVQFLFVLFNLKYLSA